MSSEGNDSGEATRAPEPGAGFDIRAYVQLLLGYKWLIMGVAAVVISAVVFWTIQQPSVFEASCSIEYDPNPPRPLGKEIEDVADPIGSFWSAREFFETQNRIIASRSIAERVVNQLGLHHDPDFFGVPEERRGSWQGAPVAAAAAALQARLTIEPVRETRIVEIKIRDSNPERAATLANAVADAYIEKTMEDRLGSTVSALNWLGTQLDTLRVELEQSELALHRFKEEHNVLSVSMEDRQNLVAAAIQRYSEALTETRMERIDLQARLARLRSVDIEQPERVQGSAFDENDVINHLRRQYREKSAERERMAARYGESYPRMQEIDAEMNSLRDSLLSEIESQIGAAEADLTQVRMVEGNLEIALEEVHNAGLELNLREIEYQRLYRERENREGLYTLVLERNTETDLTRMLHRTHVRIIDRALPPSYRVSPNLTTNTAGGIAAGVALGIALAFLVSRLDRRIRLVEDVEALGVPVLGVLPRMGDQEATRRSRYRRGRKDVPSPDPDTARARDLIVHTHPMSSTAESCRTIRTNLMFMSADRPTRTLVVTSPNPREGKTTVASNLSITLAQSGKRVLLVDTDLRRPRIHRIFGVPSTIGVTSFLVGENTLEEVVSPTEIAGLHILPCGPIPPNPSELLHSQRFELLVREAMGRYDRIIFDSPPLGAVTDAAVLAPQVDTSLLVVKADQTTRDAVASALRQLRDVGAHLAGSILNDIDTANRRYGTGYYHYYRREGYYYNEKAYGDDAAGGDEATRDAAST